MTRRDLLQFLSFIIPALLLYAWAMGWFLADVMR